MKTPSPTCTLTAAGDIVVRHSLFQDGYVVCPAYARTLDYLRAGDLIWGSCEVQFSNHGYRTDAPIAYLVPPAVAADLGAAGYNVMTVATNHTCDFGPGAFMDTLKYLEEAGITAVGGGANLKAAQAPVIGMYGGLRIGMLAVSCLVPPDYAATSDRPGIAPLHVEQSVDFNPLMMMIEPGAPLAVRSRVKPDELAGLQAAIRNLRKEVDFVLVSVHWGYGRGNVLAEYQRPLAHAIVEAGADLVLGNHPHSPAGMETHMGKPIIYSLGNHIAQQAWDEATPEQQAIYDHIDPWSLVASLELAQHAVRKIQFRVTQCERATGLPGLVENATLAEPVLRQFQAISAAMGTDIEVDGIEASATFTAPDAQ